MLASLVDLPEDVEPVELLPIEEPVAEPVDDEPVEPLLVDPIELLELESELSSSLPRTSTRCPTYFCRSSDLPVRA